MIIGFYLALIIFLLLLIFYLYFSVFSSQAGPVYQPTPEKQVKAIFDLIRLKKNDFLIDLGSGDGRILIEAGKRGIRSLGYEIDPLLYFQSKKGIKKEKLSRLAQVKLKSFWQADFNQGTIIFAYLLPKYLEKLDRILKKSLKKEVLVITHRYQFPQKKYSQKSGPVYRYWFKPQADMLT